jgi:hypothetical protein
LTFKVLTPLTVERAGCQERLLKIAKEIRGR